MRWTSLPVALLAPVVALAPSWAVAQGLGPLEITAGWARPAAQGGSSAVFVHLKEDGIRPDRLLGAACPVAGQVALQEPRDGSLQTVSSAPIPGDGSTALAPGGLQITLSDLHAPLRPGMLVPCTLRFADHGERIFEAVVAQPGATEAPPLP